MISVGAYCGGSWDLEDESQNEIRGLTSSIVVSSLIQSTSDEGNTLWAGPRGVVYRMKAPS
jgi:hypothetical protein